jgi:hypothetical protein
VDLPLSWSDITQRLVRLEATVVLNVFAAGLVTSARRDIEIEVEDLRGLPVRRPRDAWWPGGVRAYGCLARLGGFAPFFVAVDRAGVPTEHRRALVAAWYAFCESDHVWGRDGIPPILVICDQPEQEEKWAEAVLASADRRKVAPLTVLLTHRSLGFGEDPGRVAWRTSDNLSRATLNSRLLRARRFQ